MPGWRSLGYHWDARAVKASRVLLGLLLLHQTVYFTAHREVWLCERGVAPAALFYTWHASRDPNPWLIFDALPLLTLLHGCALALVVGYRPRLAALVGGWLFSGLALRTTAVTAGDEALRSLLFLFAFQPGQPPALPLSLFSLGIAAQIACIHVTTAALKRDREWATGAVMTLLHVTTHAKRNAAVEWLRGSPSLCQLLTHGALALETWGSWLLLVPQPALRTAALVAFAALHVGLFVTLDVGLYSPAMVAALVAQLPTPAVDGVLALLGLRGCDDEAPTARRLADEFSDALDDRWRRAVLVSRARAVKAAFVCTLGASMVYSVQQSLRSLRWISGAFVPAAVVSALSTFGMANAWATFGSLPNDTWIRIYGRTDAGQLYDLNALSSASLWRPTTLAEVASVAPLPFEDHRWRGFFQSWASRYREGASSVRLKQLREGFRDAVGGRLCGGAAARGVRLREAVIEWRQVSKANVSRPLRVVSHPYEWRLVHRRWRQVSNVSVGPSVPGLRAWADFIGCRQYNGTAATAKALVATVNNERAVRHAEWWEGWRGSDHAAANEWGAEHALALAAGVVAVRVVTS